MEPPGKSLRSLLAEVEGAQIHGGGDPRISSIEYDSRRVTQGSLFVAMRGLQADGTQFIRDAVQRGATAVAGEHVPIEPLPIPFVEVTHARKVLAELAWTFYDHPERKLVITGMTGTNGKTTSAFLLRDVLESAGHPAGLAGTLGVYYGDVSTEPARTTPESVDLAAHFAAMRDRGFRHLVMEVTSIGIDLERTWRLPFRVAVFTNLTRDHLDYHGTEEAYREAKLRLFREQVQDGYAVLNADDPQVSYFMEAARGKVVTYGMDSASDYRAVNVHLNRQAVSFNLRTAEGSLAIEAPLIGRFNIYNLLAVIASAHILGVPLPVVQRALREAHPARGRAEIIPSSAPFTVIVDYAHTPDALEKILSTLRDLKPRRILTVVGAGGDRDRGKRPLMAEVAFRLSDLLFLTSDNPRSEDPEAILDDMVAGLPRGGHYVRNADRRTAVNSALSEAREGDIVLIAGKGHETYQEIRGEKYPFDDRRVALEWLERARWAL
jgi:UDP-N-acetylmuramoyl-L-alanyl-D-glutamate--2,6-diaminopimelate ligase